MSLLEKIEKCNKIDNFENLEIGDYIRYITFDKLSSEWLYRRGGYLKKVGINIKNIPYIVLYKFGVHKTFVVNQYKILDDDTQLESIFFVDPTVERRIPPPPKRGNEYFGNSDSHNYGNNNNTLDAKDYTILNLNEKMNESKTEITYLKNKLKMFEKENKVLRMAMNNR